MPEDSRTEYRNAAVCCAPQTPSLSPTEQGPREPSRVTASRQAPDASSRSDSSPHSTFPRIFDKSDGDARLAGAGIGKGTGVSAATAASGGEIPDGSGGRAQRAVGGASPQVGRPQPEGGEGGGERQGSEDPSLPWRRRLQVRPPGAPRASGGLGSATYSGPGRSASPGRPPPRPDGCPGYPTPGRTPSSLGSNSWARALLSQVTCEV